MPDYIQISGEQIKTFPYNGQKYMLTPVDDVSGVPISVDFAHHEIHEGDCYNYTGATVLGLAGVHDVIIITPNTTRYAHLVGVVYGNAEANVLFYEGITTSADGTVQSAYNRNRNSSNTNTTNIYTGGTVTETGTLLYTAHFGSGRTAGGLIREQDEWILKKNTKYLLRITSEAASNDIGLALQWYEHTDSI